MDSQTAYNHIRSKFVNLKETRALIKKHRLKIKHGLLSNEESNTVAAVTNKFLADRGLTLADLKSHLVESSEFPIHDLLYECTQACIFRTYMSIYTHLAYTYHPYIRSVWGAEEEIQLLDLVNQKGFKWREISYHLCKYKDYCRLKYLAMKGELSKGLSKGVIQRLLKGMPATEEEWEALARELRLTREQIRRGISKYLNGKELEKAEDRTVDIRMCLLLLNNNHYCRFTVDVVGVMEYLNSDPETFNVVDRIDGENTPFVSRRGKKLRTGAGEPRQDTGGESHARFLARFLDFFVQYEDFNLDVPIRKEDVFWLNITRELVVDKSSVVARFNQLMAGYCWRTYKDVYDSMVTMAYDYVMMRVKSGLIEKSVGVVKDMEH